MNRTLKVITAFLLTLVVAVGCKPDEPLPIDDPDDPVVLDGCVDLGLPSGTLWAIRNLGAETPEDRGDYYAWGETVTKDLYDWKSYKYCTYDKEQYLLTKYCTDSSLGFNDFVDDKTVLELADDAVTANWGEDWRMPTREDWEELLQNTTWTWTTQNGVEGGLLKGENGNSLFLPATGFCLDNGPICTGLGIYWSSTLQTSSQVSAWSFHFDYEECHVCGTYERSRGQCVRAVRSR